MAIIKDGSAGYTAKVNAANQLSVLSVQASVAQDSAVNGEAWNLNTGLQVTTELRP